MVKYPLRVDTATFREWLSEFGKRVSKKLYKKLDYDKWRPMYLWSKPGTDWEEIEINVFDCPDMVYIVPRHNDKLSPNGVEVMLHKNSFGDYLIGVMEDYNTTLSYSDTSLSAISNALGTAADATYDTYTKVSNMYETIQNWQPYTIDLNVDAIRINGGSLEEYVEKTVNKINDTAKEKENNKMMKFDFGPVDSSVHMSMYGMAIKNASGTYVAYDVKTGSIMDVDILNFEGANKFMYKMPVALNAVREGDVVIHARKPMFVSEVDPESNRMIAVDIYGGEEKIVVPTQSPFGFSFITKVVSLIDFANGANASNPFGNMLPLLLMSDSKSNDNSMLMAMTMMGGHTEMMQNPMMLYALMNKDGKANDMLPLLLMGAFKQPTHSCACGDKCSCHKAE